MIRNAKRTDAAQMLAIYSPHILDSAVSFETELPTLTEFESRIEKYSKFGWLVAEIDEKIAGYAYACGHRERKAYQWCCEVSVYMDESFTRQGLARELYEKLFVELRKKGYVNAYAGITLPNDRSVQFHEALGFRHLGTYDKIGYKHGRWRDVGWWSLKLQTPPENPLPPI